MSDFDWSSIPYAAVSSGHCSAAIVGDATTGLATASWPLAEDGNYSFWVFADPYKATIAKEDGSEVEEDIYESYNLTLILGGDFNPLGQGVRINSTKYLKVNEMDRPTYELVISDAPVTFHFDKAYFFQKGKEGLVIAVRDSNFYIAKCDCNKPEQQTALGAKALAIGGYWVHGGD